MRRILSIGLRHTLNPIALIPQAGGIHEKRSAEIAGNLTSCCFALWNLDCPVAAWTECYFDLVSGKSVYIINIDADDYCHKAYNELVNCFVVDFLIDYTACEAPEYAAYYHQYQY